MISGEKVQQLSGGVTCDREVLGSIPHQGRADVCPKSFIHSSSSISFFYMTEFSTHKVKCKDVPVKFAESPWILCGALQ